MLICLFLCCLPSHGVVPTSCVRTVALRPLVSRGRLIRRSNHMPLAPPSKPAKHFAARARAGSRARASGKKIAGGWRYRGIGVSRTYLARPGDMCSGQPPYVGPFFRALELCSGIPPSTDKSLVIYYGICHDDGSPPPAPPLPLCVHSRQ